MIGQCEDIGVMKLCLAMLPSVVSRRKRKE